VYRLWGRKTWPAWQERIDTTFEYLDSLYRETSCSHLYEKFRLAHSLCFPSILFALAALTYLDLQPILPGNSVFRITPHQPAPSPSPLP
jgi:hypothetical protein